MIHLICYNLLRSDCNSTQILLIWYARTSSNPHISCQHWCQDTWMPRRTAGAHPWSNAPGELASNWPWRGCRGRSLAGLGPWADLRWIPWKNDKLGKYWANTRTSWTIWLWCRKKCRLLPQRLHLLLTFTHSQQNQDMLAKRTKNTLLSQLYQH